jgi:hypothetical protein
VLDDLSRLRALFLSAARSRVQALLARARRAWQVRDNPSSYSRGLRTFSAIHPHHPARNIREPLGELLKISATAGGPSFDASAASMISVASCMRHAAYAVRAFHAYSWTFANSPVSNGKLLIKPSKKNVETFLDGIRRTIKAAHGVSASDLIDQLNPKIRGWAKLSSAPDEQTHVRTR